MTGLQIAMMRARAVTQMRAKLIPVVTPKAMPLASQKSGLVYEVMIPAKAPAPIPNHPRLHMQLIEHIQHVVADFYRIPVIEMKSERRTENVTWPRQIAIWFAKTTTRRSLPTIGRLFGGRDHTTIMHAVRKVERLLLIDIELASEIAEIRARLAAN